MSISKHFVKYFILAFFLKFAVYINAQEYCYKHFNSENGLPSSEVYHTIQDSKGYIWFATDMGVSRFNGYEFINYDIEDGLINNTVFEIFEDKHGKIWFLSLLNKLSYYYNDSIYQYKYNDIIEKHSKNKILSLKRSFFIDSLDNLYLSVKSKGILKISPKGAYTNLQKNDSYSTLKIVNTTNKLLAGYKFTNNNINRIIYESSVIEFKNKKLHENSLHKSAQYFCEYNSNKQSLLIAYNKTIYKLINNKIIQLKTFNSDILWFSKDKHNKYWVSVRNSGIFCYSNDEFSDKTRKHFLKNNSISSILIDKDNAYWFTSLNNGVFYLATPSLKTISETIGKNIHNFSIGKQIQLATMLKSEILVFDKQHVFIKKLKTNSDNLINRIIYDPKINSFWIASDQFVAKLKQNELVNTQNLKPSTIFSSKKSTKAIVLGLNSSIWLCCSSGLYKIKNNKIVYSSSKTDNWSKNIYSMVFNANGSLWLGTLNGLWKYQNGEFIYYGNHNKLLKTRINALLKYKNKLFVGTKGAGLIIYNINNESIQLLAKRNGLTSNSITSIANYNNKLFVATNKGLNIINIIKDSIYTIKQFDIGNGLLSNEINQLLVFDSTLYIIGKKGINYININKLNQRNRLLNTYIEKIKIGNTDTIVKKSYELGYKQNFINISFKAISFNSKKNIQYRYKMYPIATNWIYTQKNELQFISLPSGTYTFMVSAKNKSGQWNTTNTTINFVIKKPFWLSWWFIALIIALIIIITIAIFNNRITHIQKENMLKKELNLYMKKAINSQINPHFLFNTLNSINQHILKNDKLNSSKYLNRFSVYIRSVLNALKNDFQSLSEELKISELYLKLEQIRLKEKLKYEVKIDKSVVSKDIYIPTLIITPFLENAIWLGILPKKEPGKIEIFIHQENKVLTISIIDNGIGRKKSLELQSSPDFKLQSPSSKNTFDRVKLLNNLYADKIDISYIDINKEGETGTIVNIKIKNNCRNFNKK